MKEAIIWLAEMCVFQETGLFPHEYKEEERAMCTQVANTFAFLGEDRAKRIVFAQIRR